MKNLVLYLIRFYQKYLSFDSGVLKVLSLSNRTCRFNPSCSEYAYQAISRYGIILGSWKGTKRIFRCNPGYRGGNDPLQ